MTTDHTTPMAAPATDGANGHAAVEFFDVVKRFVKFGSSPRGAQAIMLGAKITALLDGRFAPSIEDVQKTALPALRHRVLLNFEGEAGQIKVDDIITKLLDQVKTPAQMAA
jgi:MoxR-like ATPase